MMTHDVEVMLQQRYDSQLTTYGCNEKDYDVARSPTSESHAALHEDAYGGATGHHSCS